MSGASLRVTVEADGGSRGNPGLAGYGAVVFDAGSGAVLAERKDAIGVATNNVAEYRGMIAGLEAALELGAREVTVRMDSKLVVEQMSGRNKIRHPNLQPLARRANALRAQLGRISFEWIPRELNKHADRLANEAMDAAAGRSAPRPARDTPVQPEPVHPEPGEEAATAAGWIPPINEVPTRLVLLRHGQTAHSVEYRFSGRTDLPLDDAGRRQVEAAARRLERFAPVAAVISSPLTRTRQTAQAVATRIGVADTDIVIDEGFAENHFGEWEALTSEEIGARWADEFAAWQGDHEVRPPGGESFADVGRRVRQARDRVLRAYPGRTVIVVTHVVPIKSLLRFALAAPASVFRSVHLDPACASVIDYYASGASVVRVVNEGAFELDRPSGADGVHA